MEWIAGVVGATISGTLVALTIGIFKLVVTVRDLGNRVASIEKWIVQHEDARRLQPPREIGK